MFAIRNVVAAGQQEPTPELRKQVLAAHRRIRRGFQFSCFSTREAAQTQLDSLPVDISPLFVVVEDN